MTDPFTDEDQTIYDMGEEMHPNDKMRRLCAEGRIVVSNNLKTGRYQVKGLDAEAQEAVIAWHLWKQVQN